MQEITDNKEIIGMPRSFVTEKGSTYTYDCSGKTTRHKAATGEDFERQDLTVFVDLEEKDIQLALRAIYNMTLYKACVAKKEIDNSYTIISSLDQTNQADTLIFALADEREGTLKILGGASLRPEVGKSVFDTRTYHNGKRMRTESHLGHRVIKINN